MTDAGFEQILDIGIVEDPLNLASIRRMFPGYLVADGLGVVIDK